MIKKSEEEGRAERRVKLFLFSDGDALIIGGDLNCILTRKDRKRTRQDFNVNKTSLLLQRISLIKKYELDLILVNYSLILMKILFPLAD